MAYTTIDKPTDYFNTVTYTGNASGQTITGVGHQPDWIWVKQTGDAGYDHSLHNSVSGLLKQLISNKNDAEITNTDTVTSANSDGFVLGADTAGPNANSNNQDTKNYVAWNWKSGGASTSTNNDGSTASQVTVNSTSGFSIVSYTGTGSATSYGHGLGAKPDLIISKIRGTTGDWNVYNNSFAAQERIKLNSGGAKNTNTSIFASLPSATVVNVGNGGDINTSSGTHLFFCFKSVKGFSRFGSYFGNGNADGTFVYCGFKPAFTMIKRVTDATEGWIMQDNKTGPRNPIDNFLGANSNAATSTTTNAHIDYVSNGFKLRHNDTRGNTSGKEYIYWAFAENPFVTSTGIPATAR